MPYFDTFAEMPPQTITKTPQAPQCHEPMGGRRRIGRLYNATEIARRMGVSRWYVQMMKRAGLKFDLGFKTSLAAVEDWIIAHPNFNASAHDRARRVRSGKAGPTHENTHHNSRPR